MAAANRYFQRPLDSLRCKLKKPLFKDDARAKKRRREGWWKSALLFWKQSHEAAGGGTSDEQWRSHTQLPPVYATEIGGRGARRPKAALLLAAAEVGAEAAAGMAYQRLSDPGGGHRAAPIYIVT
ncbi:uncharacterized protein LOC121981853 [Zingiber officinale]|nr:uncharacterized protein LOC121981853 [Zingiber officinale]XP_042390539.1 uncharacterized protein LOC121981853 [Zingiber officinale]